MNPSKKFKRDENERSITDEDIILIEPATTASVINELCQHGEVCREYHSVICTHCHLYLCYTHVETHRLWLIRERDQLINELNDRVYHLNQLTESPEKFQRILFEQTETRVPFVQQLSLEKVVNLKESIVELKQLFEPVRSLFRRNQCVSVTQIKKIKECFLKFDENKKLIFSRLIDSIPAVQNSAAHLLRLSNFASPCRQYELPTQRSSDSEMAASDELLIVNDREHLLLFNLINSSDDNLIPELIEWKQNLNGKTLDMHYNTYLKLFFVLTDEKLFSYNRASSFVSLHRFTSLPWSCTTLLNSIYVLYKYSTLIEQWVFQPSSSATSIQLIKQWKLNEILPECEHDQHLRCIRANPDQTQLAILIEDDECRWRIGLFDHNMNCLHQTETLPDASTIDWNLLLAFISNQQLLVIDATTENIYLVSINQSSSSIEQKQFSDSDYPVNACTITNNGYSQLIVKMVKPNMLKFFQI